MALIIKTKKQQLLDEIKKAVSEVKQIKAGKKKGKSLNQLLNEL